MAQIQFDIVGGPFNKQTVVQSAGSAIGSSAVRVTVDDTNATSKNDVLQALTVIEQRIREGTWPLA